MIDFPDIKDTLLCGKDINLEIDLRPFENFSTIEWLDGYRDNLRNIRKSGEYSFRIHNNCQDINRDIIVEKSPYSEDQLPIYIPNAFTPNEDGINDIFKAEIANNLELTNYHILVFDRWGNKIFESYEIEKGWDGKFKGVNMDPAVFIYVLRATVKPCQDDKTIILKGNINLQK